MKVSLKLIQEHDRLLKRLDEWSRLIRAGYANQMQCGKGCARCCHGLFDVSVFDALRIVEGFKTLPARTKDQVERRASVIQKSIFQLQPDLTPPYFLNALSDDRVDQLVDCIGEIPCPFLDAGDACLIYDNRPVTCRLEGIPMIDASDGIFSDWCEMNFPRGISADMERCLELDYYAIQSVEQDSAIFIPSIIYALTNGDWQVSSAQIS